MVLLYFDMIEAAKNQIFTCSYQFSRTSGLELWEIFAFYLYSSDGDQRILTFDGGSSSNIIVAQTVKCVIAFYLMYLILCNGKIFES